MARRALLVAALGLAGCALPESKTIVGDHDAGDQPTIDADPLAIDAVPIDADPLAIDAVPIDAEPIDAMTATPPAGNYDPLVGTTTVPANYILGRRFSLSAQATTSAAGLYLPGGGTGMVRFAIYQDNGLPASAPAGYVDGSPEVTLGTGTRPEGAIAVTIGPGNYWLFVATGSSITLGYADSNDAWGAIQARAYAPFPATLSPAPSTSSTSDAANLYLKFQ